MAAASDCVWGGLLLAGAAFEVYALKNARSGDTLSERIRAWFRVDTLIGKIVFMGCWLGFASWFLVHVIE